MVISSRVATFGVRSDKSLEFFKQEIIQILQYAEKAVDFELNYPRGTCWEDELEFLANSRSLSATRGEDLSIELDHRFNSIFSLTQLPFPAVQARMKHSSQRFADECFEAAFDDAQYRISWIRNLHEENLHILQFRDQVTLLVLMRTFDLPINWEIFSDRILPSAIKESAKRKLKNRFLLAEIIELESLFSTVPVSINFLPEMALDFSYSDTEEVSNNRRKKGKYQKYYEQEEYEVFA